MLTDQIVQELEAKHGELLVLRARVRNGDTEPRWALALKKADRGAYKMYRAAEKRGDADAQERLVVGLCVFPSREELDALLNKFPAIPEAVTAPLKRWLELDWEEEGKG